MSTEPDPIAVPPEDGPDRVSYDEGVMLDAGDFRLEQSYHRGRLARALKYLFGPGTVAGLRVEAWPPNRAAEQLEEEEIRVHPGLALDTLGRVVEVPALACLNTQGWWRSMLTLPDGRPNERGRSLLAQGWHDADGDRPSGVVVDVFLRFIVCPRGKTPAFARGPYDAVDAVRPARLRDGYQLSLVVRDALPEHPPNPWEVARAAAAAPDLRQAMTDRVLAAWFDGTNGWDEDGRPNRLPEHPVREGFDNTSVVLARVTIPADSGPEVPTRRAADELHVDNTYRRLVLAPGPFAREPAGG